MKIVERGVRKPKYPWVGRYLCAYCRSVIELHESDADEVKSWDDSQREGISVTVHCPVCIEDRHLMSCNHVLGRCGDRGWRDA